MSLTLVSVPIGNKEDITLRALKTLKEADVIIGEERKPLFRLLKELEIPRPEQFELLNEHTPDEEIKDLLALCQSRKVALVTDCGTPGFCDPGASLVDLCRRKNIPVTTNPGACSLSVFISLTGKRLDRFDFVGFLPRESSERAKKIKELRKEKKAFIVMDTPYRMMKTLEEMANSFKGCPAVLGTNLTQADEAVYSNKIEKIFSSVPKAKKEFLLLIDPR